MRKWEIAAIILALLVILGTPVATFAYESFLRSQQSTEITLVAAKGRWEPEVIRVTEGETVRLRLTSADVVHGFAAEELGLKVNQVYPGKFTMIEFVAPQAGTYKFICFVPCHPDHEDMEGQIIVEPAVSPQA